MASGFLTACACMQQPRSEQRDAAAREVEEQVQQLYGALLRGPKGQRQSEGRALAVSSPEGTKALGEGIRSLLERHVEFIHQGHHHLLPVRAQINFIDFRWEPQHPRGMQT